LAKAVFRLHGVDERGKTVLRKQFKRKDVMSFFANRDSCLIGMEACGSAHYGARKLAKFGHAVRLMAPQFVKPYVKTSESDRNDAEASTLWSGTSEQVLSETRYTCAVVPQRGG
jgi:transposase